MLEKEITEIKATTKPFIGMLETHTDFFESNQTEIDNRIAYWQSISSNKEIGKIEQDFANYIIHNERLNSFVLSTMRVYEIAMARNMYATEWISSIVNIMLKGWENPQIQSTCREIIAKLQKEIEEIKTANADNQTYLDTLKESIEKKKKWLNENK